MTLLFRRFAACALGAGALWLSACGQPGDAPEPAAPSHERAGSVTLTPVQAQHIQVAPVVGHEFTPRTDAVGYIDFDQDHTARVFAPYQGRVTQVFAALGDTVKKGQPLFALDSSDLVQAQANLISAASALELTTRTLERARKMLEVQASAQKDVEQALADQLTAQGNFKAARDNLRIFGQTEAQIDALLATRRIGGELRVASPFDGEVTARNAAVGVLLQPGNDPAPFTISRTTSVWMIASVPESDLPRLRVGQPVSVQVNAFAGRRFEGRVNHIGAALDANTRRAAVRIQIGNPQRELRAQMLATVTIDTGPAVRAAAVPANAVVREGDGTLTVFVTEDGLRFVSRPVKLGMTDHGLQQVTEGLAEGEKVAGDGALFLSNALVK